MRVHLEIVDEDHLLPQGAEALLTSCAEGAVSVEGLSIQTAVYLTITDDAQIHTLNRETRGIDRSTDVLSFPSTQYPQGRTALDCEDLIRRNYDDVLLAPCLGEIVISIDHARTQAEAYGHSLSRELGYLAVHAMFHLMGYDHMQEDEKRQMRRMEERTLLALGLTRKEGKP